MGNLSSKQQVIVFSDLDGCLLNKSDYSFQPAIPTLRRLKDQHVPLVLASSKTEPEMRVLAEEMNLPDAPLICENGGVIFWSRNSRALKRDGPELESEKTVLGIAREKILDVLSDLHAKFRFESFEQMQATGIAQATDLPLDRAEAALRRSCTEPLVWLDSDEKIELFRKALAVAELTLTKGGRFWHVAGHTTKGRAVEYVLQHWRGLHECQPISVGIGDSPIDQSMLDVVDHPIAIPTPGGLVQVRVSGQNSRISKKAGAAGWADTVSLLLDELI